MVGCFGVILMEVKVVFRSRRILGTVTRSSPCSGCSPERSLGAWESADGGEVWLDSRAAVQAAGDVQPVLHIRPVRQSEQGTPVEVVFDREMSSSKPYLA